MSELEAEVRFDENPIVLNEIVNSKRDLRGHFFSFLYRCELTTPPAPQLRYVIEADPAPLPRAGQWAWHKLCPKNLISVHEIYREFIS